MLILGQVDRVVLGRFAHLLLATSLIKIASIGLQTESMEKDSFVWGEGRKPFSVNAACTLSKSWRGDDRWEGWQRIWKLGVQYRVRVFVWLMTHGKLLTNIERRRRHLGANEGCVRCQGEEETVLHAVRDCVVAKELWRRLLPRGLEQEFFSLQLKEWEL